jgi:prepilin-type N-terminal cleavage/methylation domain-containing protein
MNTRQQKGFTLIEMAISLTVLAVLISMVATFYPKVTKILKLKRAISYVEDNIDALKGALMSQSIDWKSVSGLLSHNKDVYGNVMAYFQGREIDEKHVCVLKKPKLRVCTINDYNAYRNFMDNTYNPDPAADPADRTFFSCSSAGGTGGSKDDSPVALVTLSPGPNHNIQTPILCTDEDDDGLCQPDDPDSSDFWVVPIFTNVPPNEKMDDYDPSIVNSASDNRDQFAGKWRRADVDSETFYPNEDTQHSQTYDDIIRYLPLSLAKANCPPTNIVANIDRFWLDNGQINVYDDTANPPAADEQTTIHWVVSYAGDGLNTDEARCALDLGDNSYLVQMDSYSCDLSTDNGFDDCCLEHANGKCILSYQNCTGTHQAQIAYDTAGFKVPWFRIYDDTGQAMVMKSTQLVVLPATATFTASFNATRRIYNTTTQTWEDDATVQQGETLAIDKLDWVRFSWSNIPANTPCVVYFGDGETSGKIPDCNATSSTDYQYSQTGSYKAYIYIEGQGSNQDSPITIEVQDGTTGGEDKDLTIKRFEANPSSGTAGSYEPDLYARIEYTEGKIEPQDVTCTISLSKGIFKDDTINPADCRGQNTCTISQYCVGEQHFKLQFDNTATGSGKISLTVSAGSASDSAYTYVVAYDPDISVSTIVLNATAIQPDGQDGETADTDSSTSEDSSLGTAATPYTAPLLVRFSWDQNAFNSNEGCVIDFGDGHTSGDIDDCTSQTNVLHTYEPTGNSDTIAYEARLISTSRQSNPITIYVAPAGGGSGGGSVNEAPRIIQFKATPDNVSQATIINFKARVCEPDGTATDTGNHTFHYKLFVAGCEVGKDNTGYCDDMCAGDANQQQKERRGKR